MKAPSPTRKPSKPRKRSPYVEAADGKWYSQPMIDRIACCDCGLVHDVEYRVSSGFLGVPALEVKATRNARATAQVRRGMMRRGEL